MFIVARQKCKYRTPETPTIGLTLKRDGNTPNIPRSHWCVECSCVVKHCRCRIRHRIEMETQFDQADDAGEEGRREKKGVWVWGGEKAQRGGGGGGEFSKVRNRKT